MREGGGNCLKYLKRGGGETENKGGETKILKGGAKLSQGVGALKRQAGTPLQTMHHMGSSDVKMQRSDALL